MMIGGYSLSLYCDFRLCVQWVKKGYQSKAQYYGKSYTACARQAKKAGWKLRLSQRTTICPLCSAKKIKCPSTII